MSFRPVSARRRMNSILVSVGTVWFSFWRPSRGPTSTMRTLRGIPMSALFLYRIPTHGRRLVSGAPGLRLFAFEVKQFGALGDLVANCEVEGFDLACGGRVNGALHLHGFEDHERRAFLDALAGLNGLGDDAARHGRAQAALRALAFGGHSQRIDAGEDARLPAGEYEEALAIIDDGGGNPLLIDHGVDSSLPAGFHAYAIGRLADGDAILARAELDDCVQFAIGLGE